MAQGRPAFQPHELSRFGVKGDGVGLDTAGIQSALDACRDTGGGQVVFPAGRYLSGTIHLRSKVGLVFEAGAMLVGTTNLNAYQHPAVPDFMPEAKWGPWHRALLLGENVEEVSITGSGVINGNKVFDPSGEEKMRGPHAIVLVNCRRFTMRDVTVLDAANYGVFAQVSDDLEFRGVKFVGGWDGIHWRGAPDRWCRDVRIAGCQFYTGDDAIAGRYWHNTVIQDCLINSSCNGIHLIGPATRLTIVQNLFRGPGEQPHRTAGERRRTNMLSGIILQPGAWDPTRGPLDDVFVAQNVMENVASPITIWTKPGNTVGKVTVMGLSATGVYRAAMSVESWADEPITNVVFRNVQVEFAGGGKPWPAGQVVTGPGMDARPLPSCGLLARNVEKLTLEDVRFGLPSDDPRPVLHAERVDSLTLDRFRIPAPGGIFAAMITNQVRKLIVSP
ncbi:MAG: right-handed parallel beta-helix repeat-containing protein [Verrucomicrobiales bacterium]|nr:right-handed parallel beta-helix repeat-containing protein [Verrucomicrobiales bacterium]